MTRPRRSPAATGLVLLCCLVLTACDEAEPTDPPQRLQLDFDDLDGPSLAPGEITLTDSAGRSVDGELLSQGGPVQVGPGADGGRALELPGSSPVAALRLDLPDPDSFSPRGDDLTLAADLAWDGAGQGSDVGANVVQRGLFSDTGQYKLQVDAGVPSCRVAGSEGEVLVRAEEPLEPGSWHRLECRRHGDEVTLTVRAWESDEWGRAETFTRTGAVGQVDIAASTPLSVGAKLSAAGSLVPARPDQFHGRIDRVAVEVG